MPLDPKPEQGPKVLKPEDAQPSSPDPKVMPPENPDKELQKAADAEAKAVAKAQADQVKAQDKADGHKE